MDTIRVFCYFLRSRDMKKKIASILILGMYLFGGWGIAFAANTSDADFKKADYDQLI